MAHLLFSDSYQDDEDDDDDDDSYAYDDAYDYAYDDWHHGFFFRLLLFIVTRARIISGLALRVLSFYRLGV